MQYACSYFSENGSPRGDERLEKIQESYPVNLVVNKMLFERVVRPALIGSMETRGLRNQE